MLERSGHTYPGLPASMQPESLVELGEKYKRLGLELWDQNPKKNPVAQELNQIWGKLTELAQLTRAVLAVAQSKGGDK